MKPTTLEDYLNRCAEQARDLVLYGMRVGNMNERQRLALIGWLTEQVEHLSKKADEPADYKTSYEALRWAVVKQALHPSIEVEQTAIETMIERQRLRVFSGGSDILVSLDRGAKQTTMADVMAAYHQMLEAEKQQTIGVTA